LNQFQKILIFSFIGGLIAVLGSFILTILGIIDPFVLLAEIFAKAEITYSYDFETFGIFLKLWTSAAFLPIAGQNLLISPLQVESLLPLILMIAISFVLGYLLKIPDGLSASILVLLMSMGISMVFAIVVPHTLPSIGLSPSDLAQLRGLTDELVFLTIFTPPNWLEGSVITFGSCLLASLAGGLIHKVISPNKPKSKKKKSKKR
jgi:hypothetical protein